MKAFASFTERAEPASVASIADGSLGTTVKVMPASSFLRVRFFGSLEVLRVGAVVSFTGGGVGGTNWNSVAPMSWRPFEIRGAPSTSVTESPGSRPAGSPASITGEPGLRLKSPTVGFVS